MFRTRRSFVLFVLVSLLLHGLISLTLLMKKNPTPLATYSIELRPEPLAVSPTPKTNRHQAKPILERQIVEQEERKTSEPPPDTRFLSAQNQQFERQTVARNKGEFRNSKTQSKSPGELARIKNWTLAPKIRAAQPFSDLGLKQSKKIDSPSPTPDLAETPGAPADGSQTQDYVKDVDQGLETLLNAREFKYYTYYNRIRRQLSQHWEPKVRHKLTALFRQGRQIASDMDRVTKLVVVLDKAGQIVRVQILKESGVADLDEAATEAFQSAAPFPNPPAGIVEADGTVKIRWDFVLEG
jgi:TonB family protein